MCSVRVVQVKLHMLILLSLDITSPMAGVNGFTVSGCCCASCIDPRLTVFSSDLPGGYIVSGGTFVGRWRDCVTPEEYVGYEGKSAGCNGASRRTISSWTDPCCAFLAGTFTLSQRVDIPR